MNTPPKLVFFGTETFSVPALLSLIQAGYTIAAIVTKPDTVKGRGKKQFIHPIKQIGLDHDIAVLQPEKLVDCEAELQALQADAAVLVSYGKLIPRRILNVFEPIGFINVHPSALPRYRGPSPIEATILHGDTSTAVTLMKLDEGMDTGPIYVQQTVPLTGSETKTELTENLAALGAELLLGSLPAILSGELQPKAQSNNDVSVTSLLSKTDGILDPTTDTATVLERKIRAYQGYPKPHLTVYGNDVIVTSAIATSTSAHNDLVISCANNTFLKVLTLIAPSGRNMDAKSFLNGLRNEERKNERLQDKT